MKTFKIFIACFISSFFAPTFQGAKACTWSEYSEVYRLAFFKAGITQTSGLHPFSYNAESFFNPPKADPEGLDKKRNCKEWQQKV